MRGIYEQVKKALQDVIAPEIQALKVEIKRLDEKIDTLYNHSSDLSIGTLEQIKSMKNELLSEIKRIDDKLDTAINLRERIVSLEARIESLAR